MDTEKFIEKFYSSLDDAQIPRGAKYSNLSDTEWTDFTERVMRVIAEKFGWKVMCNNKKDEKDPQRGEYLSIDAMFLKTKEKNQKDYWPQCLPEAVVEFENSYDNDKIKFCLWKILCIRSPLKVLICYKRNEDEVKNLFNTLKEFIEKGNLMDEGAGNLLIIIGNEEAEDKTPWREYYRHFKYKLT